MNGGIVDCLKMGHLPIVDVYCREYQINFIAPMQVVGWCLDDDTVVVVYNEKTLKTSFGTIDTFHCIICHS